MSTTSNSDIAVWIDNVQTPQDLYELHCVPIIDRRKLTALCPSSPSIPPIIPCASDDKENPRPAKKRRVMQADQDQTPRPPKRLRELGDTPELPPSSPTKSASSEAVSEAFEAESHQSGRLSPVKQIQLLEDSEENPVVFCNFDDGLDGTEPEDVRLMRRAIQRLADGIGILGYDNLDAAASALPPIDRMRFQYSWASDLERRCIIGSMPSMAQILGIVETARGYDRGSGVSEDEWNSEVQHPLLKLACSTCKHTQTLVVFNV
jgi:PD-(D/E)XK nuclease superfamily protein